MSDEASQNELVRDLARDAVSRVAPQEMPTFRVQADAYFRAPEAALKRASERGRDEALGFGAAEAAALVTPAALAAAAGVVAFLLEVARESLKAEAKQAIQARVRSALGKGGGAASIAGQAALPLTVEQIGLVRRIAHEKALQLSLPEERAALLADAVVGSLSLPRL